MSHRGVHHTGVHHTANQRPNLMRPLRCAYPDHSRLLELETPELVLVLCELRHGTRSIEAKSSTPLGSTRATSRSTTVDYTLPPAQGEREGEGKRRAQRHWSCEANKMRSLDLMSGAAERRTLLVTRRWVVKQGEVCGGSARFVIHTSTRNGNRRARKHANTHPRTTV